MARLPRLAVPGWVHHVIQPALGTRPVFADDRDRVDYLAALHEAAAVHQLALHAYALQASGVQLLATPPDTRALGLVIQAVGRRYVSAYNRRHGGAGTLWAGRFRCSAIEPGPFVLAALLLVDGDSGVTSAELRTGARRDPRIVDPPAYWELGNTPFEREARYRALLAQGLGEAESRRLRDAAWGGWAVAPPEALPSAGRPLRPRPRGRPAQR